MSISSPADSAHFFDYDNYLVNPNILDSFAVALQRLESKAKKLKELQEQTTAIILDSGMTLTGEILQMFRKRLGVDKEEAKRLFFKYRKGGNPEETTDPEPQKEPESTEEKIALIMDYMKDTSIKLDHIEDEIAYLKEQLEEIKKKL